MTLVRSLCTALSVLLIAAQPAAADTWRYIHNGSVMLVNEEGDRLTITYEEPRNGLAAVGVRKGTTLFTGTRYPGGEVDGMAFVFGGDCPPIDYYVTGTYRPGTALTLTGAAPVRKSPGCKITDNRWDIPAAKLVFTPVTEPAAAPADDGAIAFRYCVVGVTTSLNLRSGPGAEFGILGDIPAQSCSVEGIRWRTKDYVLVAHDGVLGWASLRYLSPQD